jgi:hypothetical protein
MLITGDFMDKFKALRLMMDAIHPEHRATTMCASAAQTDSLLGEIDRLTGTIEALHAARGGVLMGEASDLVARSQAIDKLCTAILGMHCDTTVMSVTHSLSCKLGHRKARYGAAELARAHFSGTPGVAQLAAAAPSIAALLQDAFDTLEGTTDSDIDHFENDQEEREGAPAQFAARKIMEAITALEAASRAPEVPAEACLVYPPTMTPTLEHVLGMMNFRTGPIAHLYQAAGHAIPTKCEAEQAFVLDRMIRAVLTHGDGWADEFRADMQAQQGVIDQRKAIASGTPQGTQAGEQT